MKFRQMMTAMDEKFIRRNFEEIRKSPPVLSAQYSDPSMMLVMIVRVRMNEILFIIEMTRLENSVACLAAMILRQETKRNHT